MKTILVTGSNGALGSALIARLKNDEHIRLIATSRQYHGDEKGFQLDVCNAEQLRRLIDSSNPDLVVHLAATFVNDFEQAYAVNVESTRRLLDIVGELGCRSRVVLIGSAAEYGIVQPEDNPIREERALSPVSVYGLTKAWQTQLATLYTSRGVDVVVARVFNLDGPKISEHLFIGRLQAQIMDVLAGKKSIIELGPLTAARDYLSTADAADQILAIGLYGKPGNIYHVASGKPVIMRDILIRYLSTYGIDISVVHEGSGLTNRVGYDVPVIYADTTRTLKLLSSERVGEKA